MKTIAAALAKAQMEMGPALKDSLNPAFKSKYADLASVLAACMPALNKHGIAMIQPTGEDEQGRFVKTILIHESGETLECRVPLIVAKNDMQGYGSAVTYARRYGAMSMTGVAPEDDDGNAAAKSPPTAEKPAPEVIDPPAKHSSTEGIRDAWRAAVLDGLPEDASPRMIAQAFALAIIADFAVGKEKTLESRWTRHAKMIESLREKHPDLHTQIVDAYENQMMTLSEGHQDKMAEAAASIAAR